jgi:hypothetical protein
MARVVPRRGRKEGNNPVVSRELLRSVVCRVLEREGVSFGGTKQSFEDRCWRLFKVFQFLIPAMVVASGLPVSLYGVGSYKLSLAGSGYKFRHYFPQGILRSILEVVKAPHAGLGRKGMLSRFWKALDLFLVRGSESPLQADVSTIIDFEE